MINKADKTIVPNCTTSPYYRCNVKTRRVKAPPTTTQSTHKWCNVPPDCQRIPLESYALGRGLLTEWGANAPDGSLNGAVMRFPASSRLRTASDEKGSRGERKWMLPLLLFVIKRPIVPRVGLMGLSWRQHVRVCHPPLRLWHIHLRTSLPRVRQELFLARQRKSVIQHGWTCGVNIVLVMSLSSSRLSLPIRVSFPGGYCVCEE